MLRTTRRLLAVLAAASTIGSAVALLPAAPAAADGTTHTSTTNVPIGRDYEEQGALSRIAIDERNGPQASPYPVSTDPTTGLAGTITDVNVQINGFSHERPRDVDVLLVHGDQKVVVMSDVGGTAPMSGVNVTLDDQAPDALPAVAPFATGRYRPTNSDNADSFPGYPGPVASSLSAFDGSDGNGGWSLAVVDDSFDFYGSIESWKIEVTTTGVTPYPSPITVTGATGKITDVEVTLAGLSHGRAADVDALLVGPGGEQTVVFSDAPSATSLDNVTLTFDDDTTTPIGNPITSGTYKPANLDDFADPFPAPAPRSTGITRLSVFDGTNPNGVWKLYLADDAGELRGQLSGWSLHISALDSTVNAPVITSPASGSHDTDGAVAVTGTAPAGSTISVRDNGTPRAIATAPGSGVWSTSLSGLTNGSHTLTATATLAGTTSAPSSGVLVLIDAVAPKVTSTVPAAGARAVSRAANITAGFSEAIRATSVTSTSVSLVLAGTTTRLPATVTYDSARKAVTLNPATDLRAGKTYKVTVSTAVLDLAGNPLDQNPTLPGRQPKTWTFTTT